MPLPLFSRFSKDCLLKNESGFSIFGYQSAMESKIAAVYPVYNGFEIVEQEIKAAVYNPPIGEKKTILEISYCNQGRMECRMSDGCLQYIGEGDLFVSLEKNHSGQTLLPLGFYQGIVIVVDLEIAQASLTKLLPEIKMDLREMAERLFRKDDCLLLLSRDTIQHIFAGFYTAPEEAKAAYMRIKLQELLIFLNYLDVDDEREKKTYTMPVVETVKQVHGYLTKNLSNRITIEELAAQYCISPTALKSGFRGVYGTSIAAYMKSYRIKQGAALLRESNKSIAEIAKEVGYDSQSKFGAAFKEIMKISPNNYRCKPE